MIAQKKVTTSMRVDSEAKEEAKKVFAQLGITMGEAVNLFLHQVALKRGIPFELKVPNDETLEVFKEIEAGANVEPFDFKELGIEHAAS